MYNQYPAGETVSNTRANRAVNPELISQPIRGSADT
jgi:hypothetical protein